MLNFILLLFIVGISLTSAVNAQTIHLDDFDYFVGCFAKKDSMDKESTDCSKFVDWKIIKPDTAYPHRRDVDQIKHSRKHHWVYDWNPITEQNGKVRPDMNLMPSRKLRFYILMDFFGHEKKVNVLTVWEDVWPDSLRYVTGQVGDFNSSIGYSRVEFACRFPDYSYLLVVRRSGEGYGSYTFNRGMEIDKFVEFYSRSWNRPDFEQSGFYSEASYDFKHVTDPIYQAIEVVKHVKVEAPKFIDHYTPPKKTIRSVDSVTVEVINLWELAKEKQK